MTSIKSYWHACDNFGDALTPYLIKKISGEDAEWATCNSTPSPFMVTGSILGCSITRGIIWGTGCAFQSDLDPNCFAKPSKEFHIIATRGLLSKTLVEQSGHQPLTFGDPGLLLPHYYQPRVSKKYDVGIICSWIDYNNVISKYRDKNLTVINSMGSVEDIINRLCECEVVVSSTLHGLVTAIAYKIPVVLVKFSDKMVGDGFKFRDFSSCLERRLDIINLEDSVLLKEDLIKMSSVQELSINTNELLNCCPFRKKDLP